MGAGGPQESEEMILRSARCEIERVGILGLRVADVASGANSSISQIYRHFKNRDGLLARVLGDMYDEFTLDVVRNYLARLEGKNPLTVDALVDAIPLQFGAGSMRSQELRLQVLAVSTTNEALRLRLERCTSLLVAEWNAALDWIESRMAPGESLDRRVFLMVLALQNPYYRALLGEQGFTEDEYRDFLREKMRVTR
ncbi:MAG: TetR/AcrR family transcriptional regulator [Ilumatobacteraceae bacterium]